MAFGFIHQDSPPMENSHQPSSHTSSHPNTASTLTSAPVVDLVVSDEIDRPTTFIPKEANTSVEWKEAAEEHKIETCDDKIDEKASKDS